MEPALDVSGLSGDICLNLARLCHVTSWSSRERARIGLMGRVGAALAPRHLFGVVQKKHSLSIRTHPLESSCKSTVWLAIHHPRNKEILQGQLGLAAVVIAVLQPLMGFLRPKPAEPRSFQRLVWEQAHKFLGYGALVLAWINTGIGFGLDESGAGFGNALR